MPANRTLYTSQGQPVALGPQLASGGEGAIYSLAGNPRLVAKVYHKPSAEKAEKLLTMARDASAELVKVAAWPTTTLHESHRGRPTGFIMPRVTGYEEIHKLYGPAHRRKTFPKADWAFLVHAAMNCATAFDAVHSKGYVVGDVNQSNILVSAQALVCLIDCDSFQVRSNGRLFPCEVGVAQYTPPELQDSNFRQVVRTPNHDRFGLAVLIFHLLFMGRHPFAGRFLGHGEMLLEQAIKEFRFAYASWAGRAQMAPPPFALTLDVLPPDLAGLFDRAFRPGSDRPDARPTANEWRAALATLERQLVRCTVDAGHKFAKQLGHCPWHAIMRTGGPNFFIGVAVIEVSFSPDQILLRRVWAEIEGIPEPAFTYARPRVPADEFVAPTVSAADFASNQTAVWVTGSVALLGLTLLVGGFCAGILAAFGFPILLVFGSWWLILLLGSPGRRVRRQKRREWAGATEAVEAAEADWHALEAGHRHRFQLLKASLHDVRERFLRLKGDYDADRRRLEQNKEILLRDQYLQRKFISDAVANKDISGIGSGRQVTLESHGIETAYDISEDRLLAIRGFGPVLVGNLIAWKQRMAAEFRFDPTKGIPETELAGLTQKYKQEQDLLRAHMERGAADLRGLATRATQELRRQWLAIQRLVVELAIAEADLEALGWH
jgi:DNA-binding helix-hairpin-helix protein with protein kinase domain